MRPPPGDTQPSIEALLASILFYLAESLSHEFVNLVRSIHQLLCSISSLSIVQQQCQFATLLLGIILVEFCADLRVRWMDTFGIARAEMFFQELLLRIGRIPILFSYGLMPVSCGHGGVLGVSIIP